MRRLFENFKLELAWLVLVAVLVAITPRPAVGQDESRAYLRELGWCPNFGGLC